ncbi:hypothetical protein Tco_0482234 [Tanacetum coccineum]
MAERIMEELLRAPTKGYGEAIVLPEINADHFEIKTNLLQLVQANPFKGRENENPHAHINSFKRITLTLRFRNVPNDVIKLMMFPYSLEGAAKTCGTETEEQRIKSKQNSKEVPLKSHLRLSPFLSGTDVLTTLPKTTPISESDIPKSLPKPNIPYPSRRDDQKSRDKASNQMEKIF